VSLAQQRLKAAQDAGTFAELESLRNSVIRLANENEMLHNARERDLGEIEDLHSTIKDLSESLLEPPRLLIESTIGTFLQELAKLASEDRFETMRQRIVARTGLSDVEARQLVDALTGTPNVCPTKPSSNELSELAMQTLRVNSKL
jgi:predicted nuclease with TOPRIM domain